ncbi:MULTISPECIES: hypothetical protein [unclassified Luteimonas]|uniref:hypothetical protein n=1 Tax=unclassified Luteimonas TaxID=2629088 RepID=UPI0018F102DB|nr:MULTISPECIES: hypothetical protein [unclassified Luteimonas]MBJ6981597.1 hypothetical protein [Luteimonas sp. MC1572]MBJ7575836.1 hypothetical protein [Luteimonas sp. MC1828]QQO02895.1 hypothetical protein JGR64_12130 [Luteimonas sp. MC1572]
MTGGDLHALSNAELEARLLDLQRRAFEVYEDAALAAEAREDRKAYARAEAEAAPLIAEARAVNDERVRRLRRRARNWRNAGVAIAVAGTAAISWIALRA